MIVKSRLAYARAKQNPSAPRIVYGPGVKRGQFATREYVDIYLFASVNAQKVRAKLAAAAPQGMTILEATRIPFTLAGVQQLVSVVEYEVQGDFASYHPQQTLENYVSSARLEVTQRAANGVTFTRDIKPFVRRAQTLGPQRVVLTLNRVEEKWMNPLEVISAWLQIDQPSEEEAGERFTVIRQGLYWQDSQGNLTLI